MVNSSGKIRYLNNLPLNAKNIYPNCDQIANLGELVIIIEQLVHDISLNYFRSYEYAGLTYNKDVCELIKDACKSLDSLETSYVCFSIYRSFFGVVPSGLDDFMIFIGPVQNNSRLNLFHYPEIKMPLPKYIISDIKDEFFIEYENYKYEFDILTSCFSKLPRDIDDTHVENYNNYRIVLAQYTEEQLKHMFSLQRSYFNNFNQVSIWLMIETMIFSRFNSSEDIFYNEFYKFISSSNIGYQVLNLAVVTLERHTKNDDVVMTNVRDRFYDVCIDIIISLLDLDADLLLDDNQFLKFIQYFLSVILKNNRKFFNQSGVGFKLVEALFDMEFFENIELTNNRFIEFDIFGLLENLVGLINDNIKDDITMNNCNMLSKCIKLLILLIKNFSSYDCVDADLLKQCFATAIKKISGLFHVTGLHDIETSIFLTLCSLAYNLIFLEGNEQNKNNFFDKFKESILLRFHLSVRSESVDSFLSLINFACGWLQDLVNVDIWTTVITKHIIPNSIPFAHSIQNIDFSVDDIMQIIDAIQLKMSNGFSEANTNEFYAMLNIIERLLFCFLSNESFSQYELELKQYIKKIFVSWLRILNNYTEIFTYELTLISSGDFASINMKIVQIVAWLKLLNLDEMHENHDYENWLIDMKNNFSKFYQLDDLGSRDHANLIIKELGALLDYCIVSEPWFSSHVRSILIPLILHSTNDLLNDTSDGDVATFSILLNFWVEFNGIVDCTDIDECVRQLFGSQFLMDIILNINNYFNLRILPIEWLRIAIHNILNFEFSPITVDCYLVILRAFAEQNQTTEMPPLFLRAIHVDPRENALAFEVHKFNAIVLPIIEIIRLFFRSNSVSVSSRYCHTRDLSLVLYSVCQKYLSNNIKSSEINAILAMIDRIISLEEDAYLQIRLYLPFLLTLMEDNCFPWCNGYNTTFEDRVSKILLQALLDSAKAYGELDDSHSTFSCANGVFERIIYALVDTFDPFRLLYELQNVALGVSNQQLYEILRNFFSGDETITEIIEYAIRDYPNVEFGYVELKKCLIDYAPKALMLIIDDKIEEFRLNYDERYLSFELIMSVLNPYINSLSLSQKSLIQGVIDHMITFDQDSDDDPFNFRRIMENINQNNKK